MASDSTKLLKHAAESFGTVHELVRLTKNTLPPAQRRQVEDAVVEDAKRARLSLNGRALKRSVPQQEVDEEEEACVIELKGILDSLEASDEPTGTGS